MTARFLAGRIPDLLPFLAVIAAGAARAFPSRTLAAHVDVLLGLLVLVTALDIDPRRLLRVRSQLRTVVLLAVLPLLALAATGWALALLVHGELRHGVLSLGMAPAEVASVGLIGLMGGSAELAIAVLAVSLVLSAVAGPPLLAVLGSAAHQAHVLPLLARFALVVIVPLVVGVALRGAKAGLARRELELSVASSVLLLLLIFASLSDTHGTTLGSAALISAAFLAVSAVLAAMAVRVSAHRFDSTLALAIGMRDFAVAAALATAAFGPGAAQVAGVYGTMMLIAGATVTTVVRRRARLKSGGYDLAT